MDTTSLVKGVDLSHWNGAVDFPKLAADGVAFAYIKVGQGMAVDPMFETYRKGLTDNGILAMFYPFVVAGDGDAVIKFLCGVVGDKAMPGVLDWELAGVKAEIVEGWADGIKSELGRDPAAYYGLYPPGIVTPRIAELVRVFPEYAADPRLPPWDGKSAPNWLKEWMIWQSSQTARFPNESGNFDYDVLSCDFATFKRWYETGDLPLAPEVVEPPPTARPSRRGAAAAPPPAPADDAATAEQLNAAEEARISGQQN